MTRVKICGITRLEDALWASRCGADVLGFIFVEESPRYFGGIPHADSILAAVPPFITRVAVRRALPASSEPWDLRFAAVQYYEAPTNSGPVLGRTIRAIRLKDHASLDELGDAEFNADAVLLDSFHPEKLGGAGVALDWELAAEAARRVSKPVILAGGLTPENVQKALAVVRPYAVDVSTGVESEPGKKDREKIKLFIEAVREFDRRNPA
jgi:phosphoribosylanthranilate isomerase